MNDSGHAPERRADANAIDADQPPARAAFSLRGFAGDAGLVIGGAILANVFHYVFHFVLSRRLGPDAYGTLAALLGIAAIVGVVGTSIGTVAMQETARMWASHHDDRIGPFVRQTALAALLVGAAAAAGILIISLPLGPYTHIVDVRLWFLFAAYIGMAVFCNYMRGAAQGAHRFVLFALAMILDALTKVAGAIALVWAGLSVLGAVGGLLAGVVVGAAVAFAPLAVPGRAHEPVRREEHLRLGGESLRVLVLLLATSGLLFVDLIFAKHHLSGVEAGYYGAAGTIARVLPYGVGFMGMVLMPKAAAARHGHRESLAHLLKLTFGIGLLAILLGAILLMVAPGPLVSVTYGGRFDEAVALLPLYAVATALLALDCLGIAYLTATREYAVTAALLVVLGVEAAAMAAFGTTPHRLIGLAIAANGALAPIVAMHIARTLREVPQASGPLSAEA